MNRSTLHQVNVHKQQAKEGIYTMQGLALTRLLHNLIREYGHIKNNSYFVDVHHFDLTDKRLILSHVTDGFEEYKEACESETKTIACFLEHQTFIQRLIDDECDDMYRETMEEMRDYR